MSRSANELMLLMIDYAGLFPPAKLPLEPALRNFAAYRKATHHRMLARFICPASKLGDVTAYADELFLAGEQPWQFSALGSSGADAESFAAGLAGDVEAMRGFMGAHHGRAVTDVIETRMPDAVVSTGDPAATGALVQNAAETVKLLESRVPGGGVRIFLEIAFVGDWQANTRSAISAVARHNAENSGAVGVKIRTGGVKASMIPPVEQVAFLIQSCRENRVPFKATAGLHHPLRHDSWEVDVKTKMHGFINVFAAAILSFAGEIPESTLREILEDESSEGFSFDDQGLRWRDYRASCEQITQVRREFAISFGSCSFTEPIEDLQKLGIL